jgi:hypothetical protein
LSGSGSPLNNFGGLGCLSFSSGFDIAQLHLSQTFGLHTVDNQPHNAAATISARQNIASASHIVVTFNFRFRAHNGLKPEIAACPKRANRYQLRK